MVGAPMLGSSWGGTWDRARDWSAGLERGTSRDLPNDDHAENDTVRRPFLTEA